MRGWLEKSRQIGDETGLAIDNEQYSKQENYHNIGDDDLADIFSRDCIVSEEFLGVVLLILRHRIIIMGK